MSESHQRQTKNKVGGTSSQVSNASSATQLVEFSDIKLNLTQEVLTAKRGTIEDVLKEVLAALDRLGLKEGDKADLKAQTETAQAQMKATNPHPTIISACLSRIWDTLKGVASSAAASGAGILAKELLDKITAFLR